MGWQTNHGCRICNGNRNCIGTGTGTAATVTALELGEDHADATDDVVGWGLVGG
jgi:hypothetical protein